MTAICKHEFRSYINSPIAYITIGLFLLITSIYYYIENIAGKSADLSNIFDIMSIILMFVMPIITSRTIAEDRKTGMEVLIITSPTKISGLVIGKFLAVYSIFLIMTSMTLIYPFFLLLFARLSFLSLLGNYIGFLLLGAAVTAFGVFVSSFTENQVVASITSFIGLLVMMIIQPICTAIGGNVSKILRWFSIYSRYDELNRGIFSLNTILYYVSFTFLFLYFTTQIWKGRRLINERITLGVTAVSILAIVIIVNLITGLIPIKIDLSSGKLYSIGESTKSVIKGLNKKIVVYGLFDENKVKDEYKEVQALLEKYKLTSNGNISIKYIDPDKNPEIVGELDPKGTLELKKNDFVVVGVGADKRVKVVYEELFITEFDQKTSTWFNTGTIAEQAFTNAIIEASKEEANVIYFTVKTDDIDFINEYSSLLKAIEKYGYKVDQIDLSREETVPQNAAAIIYLSPKEDLKQEELQKIENYLGAGGSAAFLLDSLSDGAEFIKFNKLLQKYKLALNNDRIRETDVEKRDSTDQYHLILEAQQNVVIPLEFFGMVFPDTSSIAISSNILSSQKVIPLVRSGESSFSERLSGKEKKEVPGPHVLAAASERNTDLGVSKVLLIGNGLFLSNQIKQENSPYYGNGLYFFSSALAWLYDKGQIIEITSKNYIKAELQITRLKASYIGFLIIGVMPFLIFSYGIIRWRKRRQL